MLAEKNRQGQSKRRIGPLKKESLSNPSGVGRLAGLLWLHTSTQEWAWTPPPTSNRGRKKMVFNRKKP